jgi:putative hydrolase of the HAD superfamily
VVGLHKPDIAAYQLMIDENNLVPGETVFIDDSLANVEGAEKAGIKGFHIPPGKSILDIDFESFKWK